MRLRGCALIVMALVGALAATACGPPPVPGPGRAAPDPGVFALGDSVMLGGADALRAAIPGIDVDAVQNRQFHEAPGIVALRAQAGTLPGTVVVHLGTNGSLRGDTCDALVASMGDRRVILVNLSVPRSWEAANNDALLQCAVRNGAAFVDWHSLSAGRADLLASDWVHLRPAGAQAYAAAIAAAVAAPALPA
jgi:hypothetical protein